MESGSLPRGTPAAPGAGVPEGCTVFIRNRQKKYPLEIPTLRGWAARLLRLQGCAGSELSLVFVNNRRIRAYNRDYRGIDKPTDVLAFPMREGVGGDLHPDLLGDVVISVETAEAEARRFGRPLEAQLLVLLIHGVLHLLGYDHTRSEAEAVRMEKRERFLFLQIMGERDG